MNEEEQLKYIATQFKNIMDALGLDTKDPSLKDTPMRVAKMYTKELFYGLNPDNEPKITVFPNTENYDQILVVRNITTTSVCEHHFVPIVGVTHVAYMPGKHILGLSKFNRIVQFMAARPQVQEKLTNEIGKKLGALLKTENIAVIQSAVHHCCTTRGVRDSQSSTVTSYLGGKFRNPATKMELFKLIEMQ